MVINADWSIDAGRQFDRTAEIWIGGANVYFGTTAEPSHTVARSWHVESNLTDYSPLFTTRRLAAWISETWSMGLYQRDTRQRLHPVLSRRADAAAKDCRRGSPLSASSNGGTVTLNTTSDKLAQTLTLPTNVEGAYLDVFSQGQSGDEFWYSCAPNDVAAELFNCGGTAFREAEVSIDGHPQEWLRSIPGSIPAESIRIFGGRFPACTR